MDLVFNHLLKRAQPEKAVKVGSPWLSIPIKNDKYARDTTEVHMANQGLTGVEGFEKFMNLEILWLNGNQLTEVQGLDNNFRIKHIYLQDNKIRTLKGSLQSMGHLETLVIYNNELRDLDRNLEFLEEFTYLKELELFQNPLAEEPYYRQRVIRALPTLVLLDRHIITEDERRKVEAWAKDYYAEAKIKKKQPPRKKVLPSQVYSKGERLLYQEVDGILRQKEQTRRIEEELEQTRIREKMEKTFENRLPTNPLKEELRRKKKEEPISVITDWEKGKLKKLFKKYDLNKKATITQDDLNHLYQDMIKDLGNIGKVPAVNQQEFVVTIMGDNLEMVQWDTFCFNLNKVQFQRASDDILLNKINEKYYEFNKKLNTGKREEGKELLYEAIRLENARDMEETQKYINRKKDNVDPRTRFDSFNFEKYKLRSTFSDTAKYIL